LKEIMQVSVHEAKTQLSRLLDLVQDGEEVIIHRHGKPVARLTPVRTPQPIPFGVSGTSFRWRKAGSGP
jgi:prevent-host-death family protein